MLQSQCLIRIGVSEVRGLWIGGRAERPFAEAAYRSGGEGETSPDGPTHHPSPPAPLPQGERGAGRAGCNVVPSPLAGEGQGEGALRRSISHTLPSLSAAISKVLSEIAPKRRLFAPRVVIGLAAPHVQAVIMPFAKLPKAQSDRDLLIAQRFCRECRADPAAVEIRGAPLGRLDGGGESILCCAVSRTLLAEIAAPLAERGFHADVIAPDYLLSFAEAGALEAPGIALMQWSGASTILVWDRSGKMVHIAYSASRPHDAEMAGRTATRLKRYAGVVGEGAPIALYADEALADAAYGADLKLMTWPTGRNAWSQLGARAA
jgi:hypothetical protein